jgi:hypothetical protein
LVKILLNLIFAMKPFKLQHQFFLLSIALALFSSNALSQVDVFLSKPDSNIFKVIGIDQSSSSFGDTARILEYNANGLLIEESVPKYYMYINYRYNDNGQLTEKEALYGESFANGTTLYSYDGDTLTEKSLLMVSFQKKIMIMNKQGKPITEKIFYAAGYSSNSYIKQIKYNYSVSEQLTMITSGTDYHDYSKEPEDYYEMDEDQIINELQAAKLIKQENIRSVFNYKNNLISSEITYNSDLQIKLHEKLYKYDGKGKLIQEKEITYTYPESPKLKPIPEKTETIVRNKYNQKGELIEIKQINKGYTSLAYYVGGKLVKETELYKDKKIEGTVVNYQYVYYK